SAQPPAKPPALPPINPAVAKSDQTITGLDGPGFDIVAGGENELVAVACDQGTIQVFKKDNVKAGAKPDVWKAHQGPVVALAWNGGPLLASAGSDKKINFWRAVEGKVAHTAPAEF